MKLFYLSTALIGIAVAFGYVKQHMLEKELKLQREIIEEYKKVVNGQCNQTIKQSLL